MAYPKRDASGKFPRKKLGRLHTVPKVGGGVEYFNTAREARERGDPTWKPALESRARRPFPPEPAGYNQDVRAYLNRKGAKQLGISEDAYSRGLHSDLGGEDWANQIPKGNFDSVWARAFADKRAQMAAEEHQKTRPLTQQEKDFKEYDDMLADEKKRRFQKEYNAQQSALGGDAIVSNVGLSGPPLTAEDALQVAQLSPYWKAASLAKLGYDVATGEDPSLLDAGLAIVGYGGKTKIGKGIADTLKSLWRRAPKKGVAAATIPFFASEAKPGAYPKEGFRPEPVEPQPIDHGRGVRAKLNRIRRQQMLR